MTIVSEKLTVSGLVNLIREVVETNFVTVTVEGEVSNFSSPASGHWYLSLKDSGARLRAVMFRGRNRLVDRRPEDGMQVVCSGTISVYSARGDLQMIVDDLAVSGQGDWQKDYEKLKNKLAGEGLFATERKKTLPAYPRSVGIVTSATGAAIQDILQVLKRRAPDVHVLVSPVKVQGHGAADEISEAISDLNRHGQVDVLIVGRGGGSVEDLWAFNEEVVARAIAASDLPVISAIGHEADFTISDLVADLRAPTPSAAAELVAKNRLELEAHLDHLVTRIQSRMDQSVALVNERLNGLESRLFQYVREFSLLPDHLEALQERLNQAMKITIQDCEERLGVASARLHALSPLNQLDRGYVIASRKKDGTGVTDPGELSRGETIWLRFARGRAKTTVEDIDR